MQFIFLYIDKIIMQINKQTQYFRESNNTSGENFFLELFI